MPTVHLSLPEKVYQALKRRAASMGIQVTDLIKLYISMGLNKAQIDLGGESEAAGGKDVGLLERRLTQLEKRMNNEMTYIHGKVREFEDMFLFLVERMDQLEELVMKVLNQKKMAVYAGEE